MTKEEKSLLLKDLCARLPYGVMVTHKLNSNVCGLVSDIDRFGNSYVQHHGILKIDEIKPYLRPMSSMTKEERRELCNIRPCYISSDDIVNGTQCNTFIQASECQDYLNAHHFDYRSLIEKGLALEAPKGMYEIVTTNI